MFEILKDDDTMAETEAKIKLGIMAVRDAQFWVVCGDVRFVYFSAVIVSSR